MAYSLGIFLRDTRVGTLTQDEASGLLSITYQTEWQQNGYAISTGLPLDNQHSLTAAYNYLDNLLPEGEARKLLALDLGVSEKQVYPQIRVLGQDLSGAFSFTDNAADLSAAASFRLLGEQELTERLNHKEDFGLLQWDDKPRLSVAGVQDKLNVFVTAQGEIGFGDGAYCSTHILKFEKPSCEHLVLNEYICMKLSSAIGLPTAEVAFKRFGSHPALLVTRFDRRLAQTSNRVLRRHVIDGCQALNLSRDYKYERNLGDGTDVLHIRDGASLQGLFALCERTSSPVKSMQWLINWQLFNLMINNYDSHGKNVSLYFSLGDFSFTPAYDLVNVAMFEQFKHVLAMAMGDEFDPKSIHAYQIADFAETCGLDRKLVSRMLTDLAKSVLKALDDRHFLTELIEQQTLSSAEHAYIDELLENIRMRTTHLQS
ncbi:HipA domain-containing protein [Paraglaciecola aquimarina]|uniref:HipA domain-containing protein n=1 Tax=Paraglaciecola algarum TaxID=3050085 RepID=A0ABS9D908_9ALTE|nr:HipA domain-containing protein [Paraglaciecola sp. G1-23]MCF2949430.1 HipA domain-containing protein [Paraglaciecola sp. G1-23]